MSARYFALLTNIGVAKIANAAALGIKLNITEMAVGDGGGTLPTPTPDQTGLVNERRRAPINQLSIDPLNDAQIIVEQVIPENVGGWWIKEVGLYDEDGDLVAVSNCPETYKPLLQEGSGRTQIVRMVIIVSNTANVTVKIDPAIVLASRDFVASEINKHRAELASNYGASQIGLEQTGTVQGALYGKITPQMFGAKGNFNSTTLTGNDDTAAFRAAIAKAIELGCQEVSVPAGNYLITDELNLGGIGYLGANGVTLAGANWNKSLLWFKAATPTSVCISSLGGSGSHTSRALNSIGVRAHPSTIYSGIGLQLRGSCFFLCSNFLFTNLGIGIHLYNAFSAGVFTEFNRFNNGRLQNNSANIFFEVNGGDNSFHGNDFLNIQNQVKPGGGIGVKVRGTTKDAYLYNQNWQMNFFGGSGCYALDLAGCNTDHLWGNLTHEASLICKTNDAKSVFEFKGYFSGIGSITYDVFEESTKLMRRAINAP